MRSKFQDHIKKTLNVVKTDRAAPCDYAVLLSSPVKAFELLENEAKKIKPSSEIDCSKYSHKKLSEKGNKEIISQDFINEVYKSGCFDGQFFCPFYGAKTLVFQLIS